ncbi:MAG: caspase family protein [Rhizobiales bacterium]|nr:caspase family protein [Hyphomicrobiales bacterium]
MRLLTILFAGALLAMPSLAEARTMALLVGVANYNAASGIRSLLGPRNDVSIIWRALKARDVNPADMTVLTDGLPLGPDFPVVQGPPVSANILAALDRLAAEAQKGDTVIFYYSGHGTRQPTDPRREKDEPEADGMDQVLLPADVGAYDPIDMTIKNAIVDYALGDKIIAIRARGAFVWAVVDSCYAGTVTRGDDVVRSVDPATLGVPEKAPAVFSRGGNRHGTLRTAKVVGEGGLAGFYAVESYDQAIERPFPGYNLPMVGEGNAQRMGVFTYHLHRALTANKAASYRDLAQEIVADLSTDRTGGKVPPPVFDGDLDAALPGSTAARLPNSVTGIVAGGTIAFPVGALQGFDVGARLALYAPGVPDKAIGHADVSEASAVSATAGAIDWEQGATQINDGTISAVIAEPAINFRFVVAPPPAKDFASDAEKTAVSDAIATVFKADANTLGVSLGTAGNPDADALLRVKNGRLWLLRSDRPWVTAAGAYDETPSLPLADGPGKLGPEIKDALWRLARAAKLIRVTAALDTGADSGGNVDLTMTATLTRPAVANAKAACSGKGPPAGAQSSAIEPLLPVAAGNCSFVDIEVKNTSDQDYYVAGFYVDSLGGVAAIPPSVGTRGCVRLLPTGVDKALAFRFWIKSWNLEANAPSSTGAENFVILGVPKDNTHEPPKLCALTQPTLDAMQQTRSVEIAGTRSSNNKFATLIGDVQGSATRGASTAADDGGPKMTGRLFVFDVKP